MKLKYHSNDLIHRQNYNRDVIQGTTTSDTELNVLDGITSSTADLNHMDGFPSNAQALVPTYTWSNNIVTHKGPNDSLITTTGSWSALSGWDVTITPAHTDSRICLIMQWSPHINMHAVGNRVGEIHWYRGTTDLRGSHGAGYQVRTALDAQEYEDQSTSLWHFDAPATTTAVTYQAHGSTNHSVNFYTNHNYGGGTDSAVRILAAELYCNFTWSNVS